MLMRRAAQRLREPGFTPMPNRRIKNAVETAAGLILLHNATLVAAGLGKPMRPAAAYEEAWNEVRRNLPKAPMVFDWRQGLPSRNNNPEYRK
jgi:hypothetical protein